MNKLCFYYIFYIQYHVLFAYYYIHIRLKEELKHIAKTIFSKLCCLSEIFCQHSLQSSMDCSKRNSVKMPTATTLVPKNFCFDNFSTYFSYCFHTLPYQKSPFHLFAFHAYTWTALRKSYHLFVKLILIKIIIIMIFFSLLSLCMYTTLSQCGLHSCKHMPICFSLPLESG